MIPALDAFPASWLADAELSLTIGRPERVGLSFFSTDAAAYAAFCDELGVARGDEQRLRARFDLAPRHWVKLHYLAGARTGSSQYLPVHPRNAYPITTLRLFARQYGARDVSRLEPMLAPALAHENTTWIVTLKRDATSVEPRISGRVARDVVPRLMAAAVTAGGLDPVRGEQYLAWNRQLEAGEALWVTVDPLRGELTGLDFEDCAPASLPPGWREATAGVTAAAPRYLKCRLRAGAESPEWVLYVGVPAAASSTR